MLFAGKSSGPSGLFPMGAAVEKTTIKTLKGKSNCQENGQRRNGFRRKDNLNNVELVYEYGAVLCLLESKYFDETKQHLCSIVRSIYSHV